LDTNVVYRLGNTKDRTDTLNKPFRTPSASKKFGVYVKDNRSGKVKVVRFGAKGMSIKKNIPARQNHSWQDLDQYLQM
jgi:hypothetical protein